MGDFYPTLQVQRSGSARNNIEGLIEEAAKASVPLMPSSSCFESDGKVYYHSSSDFFSQGLSVEQVEDIVCHNAENGDSPHFPTTGNGLTLEAARDLSDRFPDSFRVHLSLLTFNEEIRRDLVPRSRPAHELETLISTLRNIKIYLLFIDPDQTIADLERINACANRSAPPHVVIARLHATSLHPDLIRDLAARSGTNFVRVIDFIKRHDVRFANIADIFFHYPAEAFVWLFRNLLRSRIGPVLADGEGHDLVICSVASAPIMRDFVVRDAAHVTAIADCLGGTTNFVTTITTQDVIKCINDLRAGGMEIRRVLVPSSIWWVDGRFCLGGGTIGDVKRAVPDIEICPIRIPSEIINWRLTVDQCAAYYDTDIERTVGLTLIEADDRELQQFEALTGIGFQRRLHLDRERCSIPEGKVAKLVSDRLAVVEGTELVLDAAALLDAAFAHQTVVASYFEPVARYRQTISDGSVIRDRGVGSEMIESRLVRRERLHLRAEHLQFYHLFCGREEINRDAKNYLGEPVSHSFVRRFSLLEYSPNNLVLPSRTR